MEAGKWSQDAGIRHDDRPTDPAAGGEVFSESYPGVPAIGDWLAGFKWGFNHLVMGVAL